jgi:hypothetical protein
LVNFLTTNDPLVKQQFAVEATARIKRWFTHYCHGDSQFAIITNYQRLSPSISPYQNSKIDG